MAGRDATRMHRRAARPVDAPAVARRGPRGALLLLPALFAACMATPPVPAGNTAGNAAGDPPAAPSTAAAAPPASTVMATAPSDALPGAAPGVPPAAPDRFERVVLPGPGIDLPALWRPAGLSGRRPAIIALHGCGGLYTARGTVDRRYRDYAARWNAAGWHVVAPDSFTPRGSRQICTERNAARVIKVATRKDDVAATFRWLASRPDVDPGRIALVGWSNGGSTLLESIDAAVWRAADRPDARPVAAIAFYPGCRAFVDRSRYRPVVPLLMLLGADDDWTPPRWCHALAETVRQRSPALRWEVVAYPGAVHGFDGTSPVRLWREVPNGVNPGGVHLGAHPEARADALLRVDAALRAALDAPP